MVFFMCENVKSVENWREIVICNHFRDREIPRFSHVNLWKMPFSIVKPWCWHYIFRDLFFDASTWKNGILNREIGHFVSQKHEMIHTFPVKTWIGYPYYAPSFVVTGGTVGHPNDNFMATLGDYHSTNNV